MESVLIPGDFNRHLIYRRIISDGGILSFNLADFIFIGSFRSKGNNGKLERFRCFAVLSAGRVAPSVDQSYVILVRNIPEFKLEFTRLQRPPGQFLCRLQLDLFHNVFNVDDGYRIPELPDVNGNILFFFDQGFNFLCSVFKNLVHFRAQRSVFCNAEILVLPVSQCIPYFDSAFRQLDFDLCTAC